MPDADANALIGSLVPGTFSIGNKPSEVAPARIREHRENVFSEDAAKQLHSTQHFRRLLSIGNFSFSKI